MHREAKANITTRSVAKNATVRRRRESVACAGSVGTRMSSGTEAENTNSITSLASRVKLYRRDTCFSDRAFRTILLRFGAPWGSPGGSVLSFKIVTLLRKIRICRVFGVSTSSFWGIQIIIVLRKICIFRVFQASRASFYCVKYIYFVCLLGPNHHFIT